MATKSNETSWKDSLTALTYLPRFFRMVWISGKWLTSSNLAARLVKALIPVAMLWVGKLIIDEIILQVGTSEKEYGLLWLYLFIEFALAVASDLLNRVISLTDGLLGDLYANRSSVELIHKAATMSLAQFEDPEFYDKLERARRQTTGRVTLISLVLTQLQELITVFSLLTGLVVFEPWLIGLLLIAIIPSFINEIYFSRVSYSLSRSWTPERRELDYLRYIGASDTTAKETKLFGLAGFISERFASIAHKYYLANRNLAIRRTSWGMLFHVIGDIAYYGAYVFIIIRTVGGILSVGDLTFLAGSFSQLRNQLQGIFSRFSRITENALFLQDYFTFLEITPIIPSDDTGIDVPNPIMTGFTFENVSFKYPGSDRWTLRNLSFQLGAKEKLALVGENGAGKTTLAKLIARLYDPTSGRILLDGVDIRDYNLEKYHKAIGVIFQDYVRYYFTAGENIGVGLVEEIENQPRIEHAADQSLASWVIDKLPDRYLQQLGRRFAGGKDLSGGEWQKIALARAYMKNAQLIILDEPTATLDARSEFEAFHRFSEMMKEKTAVLISHRFSTVRMADRILVLQNGTIREIGTHEELMENQDLYAELFTMHAKAYW
jgi:ATP-binding cassette subfamily B protein